MKCHLLVSIWGNNNEMSFVSFYMGNNNEMSFVSFYMGK